MTRPTTLAKLVAGILIAAATLLAPLFARAIPFGGAIQTIFFCDGGTILMTLGPPTPGEYTYTLGGSFSYLYGPPAHPGQWLLGHYGLPSICWTGGFDDFVASAPTIIFHGSSP